MHRRAVSSAILERSACMPAAIPLKRPVKVGQLVRRRLKELKRTPRELADALQVTERFIAELVSGRRLPPAPSRADVYAPMTKFLRLHRNDLPTCARAEREGEGPSRRKPSPRVRDLLLELCEPTRARALVRRVTQKRVGSGGGARRQRGALALWRAGGGGATANGAAHGAAPFVFAVPRSVTASRRSERRGPFAPEPPRTRRAGLRPGS